ncbi:MAG: hypothetical protein MJZ81_09265 [Bacteroidales bacterium]|nr:hypothetical protein [Bacteroidales bacterium]
MELTLYQKSKLNAALRAYAAAEKIVKTNTAIIKGIVVSAGITEYDCDGAHCTCTETHQKPKLDEEEVRAYFRTLGFPDIPKSCYKAEKTEKTFTLQVTAA